MENNEGKQEKKSRSLWDKFVGIFFEETVDEVLGYEDTYFDYDKSVLHKKPKSKDIDFDKESDTVRRTQRKGPKQEKSKSSVISTRGGKPKKADSTSDLPITSEKPIRVSKSNGNSGFTDIPNGGVNEAKNKKGNGISLKGILAIFASCGIVAGTGYAIANRKPSVEETNSSVVSFISDDTQIDEVFGQYSKDAETYNNVYSSTETLDTMLSGENNIVAAFDKLSELIEISDTLEKYDLDKALHLNGDVRSLTEQEKYEIENMSRADLLALIDEYNEMSDVDMYAFNQKSMDYSYLAMRLAYAQNVIDGQLVRYGTDILSTYPDLLAKAIIVDKADLDISYYSDIDIKEYNGDYVACYYCPENGSQYNAILDSRLSKLMKYKNYFDTYTSTDNGFDDFKKTARKEIEYSKICLLADYELNLFNGNESIRYKLSSSSNYSINKKIKQLAQ